MSPLLRANEINRIEGYIDREEGLRLASYASIVPADQAIVELGSASGSGALFLGSGARAGEGAHVWAIDPYEDNADHDINVYRHPKVRALFQARIAYCELDDLITIMQLRAVEAAETWQRWGGGGVGLLHMDALHDFDNTAADFAAWRPNLAPGAFVIFHDVFSKRKDWHVPRFLREMIAPDPAFTRLEIAKWSRHPKRRGQAIYRLSS